MINEAIIFGLCTLLWLLSGVSGFIYWWTKNFDLTTREIGLMLLASIAGPSTWLIGKGIHG